MGIAAWQPKLTRFPVTLACTDAAEAFFAKAPALKPTAITLRAIIPPPQ